jgi:hypothetical protein
MGNEVSPIRNTDVAIFIGGCGLGAWGVNTKIDEWDLFPCPTCDFLQWNRLRKKTKYADGIWYNLEYMNK